MKLLIITNPKDGHYEDSNKLLIDSAVKRNLETVEFDYFNPNFEILSKFQEKFLLYRLSSDPRAQIVEKYILNNFDAITFYKTNENGFNKYDNVVEATMIHEKNNIPIPKTYYFTCTDHTQLDRIVEYLGGFPVVIKLTGGSHGVGVIKADSFGALSSILDVLNQDKAKYILREFIAVQTHARLIVLGNQVVDSIEYTAKGSEFRTNVGATPDVKQKKYPEHVEKIAIEATNMLGWEFGGVDILIDNDKNYLAEVNMPCFFARAQMVTGTDISGMMIDYLMNKANAGK